MFVIRWVLLSLLSVGLLLGCSSGGSNGSNNTNQQTPVDDTSAPLISGMVFNALNGQPIRDAVVSTQPETERVSTGLDGLFEIQAPAGSGGRYRVIADHLAYDAQEQTINVTDGSNIQVDFPMQTTASGLVVSPSVVTLKENQLRETVRLTSTDPNTSFSILVADPWLSVSPSSGVIANGETLFVEITADLSELASGADASSEIVFNNGNGGRGAFVNVLFQQNIPNESGFVDGVDTVRQNDCRRPDVLRVGLGIPSLSLVQFPESVVLPGSGSIQRTIQIPGTTLFYFDSLVITELGTAKVQHSAGGPEHSVIELFELNNDDEILNMGSFGDFNDTQGRASVEVALLPGVYCFYVADAAGAFTPNTTFMVDYIFTPAQ